MLRSQARNWHISVDEGMAALGGRFYCFHNVATCCHGARLPLGLLGPNCVCLQSVGVRAVQYHISVASSGYFLVLLKSQAAKGQHVARGFLMQAWALICHVRRPTAGCRRLKLLKPTKRGWVHVEYVIIPKWGI